mmetsp:Transcript_6392/g.39879  ORF Transcript_6392/g.39879 Transcript_6392/m.39879 type:complete len:175 (-) Transcript_6392:1040-1564(-)
MAGAGAKRRRTENAKRLKALRVALVLSSVVYVGLRLGWFHNTAGWKHYLGYLITSAISALCYRSISSMAKPTYGPNGELLDGGADLSMGGTLEYLHDVLYITVFVHTASIVTDWFWLAYLVIPGYAGYMLWIYIIYPYVFAARPDEQQDSQMDAKKRAKMEKKATRTKYLHGKK